MLNYLSDLVPKFIRFDKKLDDITVLTNKHWIEVREDNRRLTLIFSKDPKVIRLSENGLISKGSWEYLGNNKIEIEIHGEAKLYQHKFHDDKILLLNLDGTQEYTLFIQEHDYHTLLNNSQKITNYITNISTESSKSRSTNDFIELVIRNDKHFHELDYPEINLEIETLKQSLKNYPSNHQVDILISFLKYHSLKKEWVQINPVLCRDLTSGKITLKRISEFINLTLNKPNIQEQFLIYCERELKKK